MTTCLESLNSALHYLLEKDDRVLIMGEDILDPYGGAFKVTRGLSTKYPDKVITTPISEAGIVGVAAGLALRGFFPIVEIMFGDFITLIADQLVNHIAKFRWMYNNQVQIPLVIRTPMGGRRSYGPTHSQTLEKIFFGIPGVHLIAPCELGNPGQLLIDAVLNDFDPVLFIENKLLYLMPLQDAASLSDFHLSSSTFSPSFPYTPTYTLAIRGAPPPQVTLVAYGYMASMARQAVSRLAYENEIFCELIVPTQIAPLSLDLIFASVKRTGRLLIMEEGTLVNGWGAEILAQIVESINSDIKVARRVAAKSCPIPASEPFELAVLPGLEDIIRAVKMMVI